VTHGVQRELGDAILMHKAPMQLWISIRFWCVDVVSTVVQKATGPSAVKFHDLGIPVLFGAAGNLQ